MRSIAVCHLGRVDYQEAWDLQKKLQNRLVDAKLGKAVLPEAHVMLLVEHPPVFTLGKNGKTSNLLLSESELTKQGASFYQIDRGGDITYHGPGQLVGYPILDLDHFFTDIHRYLRELEETIIRTCADYGVQVGRIAGRTGVWVEPDARGPERKIAALGIRCSRWVTMHGFALNLNTDLSYFSGIVPCGISDRGVTSMAKELGHAIDEAEVRSRLLRHFVACFDAELTCYEEPEGWAYLEEYLPEPSTAE
jgi:lipoyl(octanoyl) transferase